MADITFEDMLAQAREIPDPEVQRFVQRLSALWAERVIPSRKDLDRLRRLFDAPPPCIRIQDDGRCSDWLRKFGGDNGLLVIPPYLCPFAKDADTNPKKWVECPGYRQDAS